MKVKTRYGELSVFDGNDLISLSLRMYGEWAQSELEILGHFIAPGDVVVDAGAYIGTHTVAFASMVDSQGSVHSFEPNHEAIRLLLENVAMNAPNNVLVHELALGEGKALARLEQVNLDNRGGTKLVVTGKSAKKGIPVATLDSFKFKTVNFIKADVEGWELAILRGAKITIASSRPIIFLECNSLQAISNLPDWSQDNGYISYGVLLAAFNPNNFNGLKENTFGRAKECGLLLIPNERSPSLKGTLQLLGLPVVNTLDDAALLLLHKPQYAYEILEESRSARELGIEYPSPALSQATVTYESKLHDLESEVAELRGELNSSAQSLLLAKEEQLKQSVAYSEESAAASEARIALEKELRERILSTQQQITEVERVWSAKAGDQRLQAQGKVDAIAAQVDILKQSLLLTKGEQLSQQIAYSEEAARASEARATLERELRDRILSTQQEIETAERAWLATIADHRAQAERDMVAKTKQVESLTQGMESLQQDILLQKATFYRNAQETNQAHVALEMELQEELLSTQREIDAVERGWAAKLADQEVQSQSKVDAVTAQVELLTQSLLLAKDEQLRQQVAYSEKAIESGRIYADIEKELREDLRGARIEIDAITARVYSLTQSLLLAKDEQLRQEVSFTKKAIESDRIHAEIERDLRENLLAARIEIDALKLAKQDLEAAKAKVESGLVWRASEMAHRWVGGLLGKSPPQPNAEQPIAEQPIAERPTAEPKATLSAPVDSIEVNSSGPLVNENIFATDPREKETLEILGSGLFDGEYYLSM